MEQVEGKVAFITGGASATGRYGLVAQTAKEADDDGRGRRRYFVALCRKRSQRSLAVGPSGIGNKLKACGAPG
jgi:hypothetical protein